jgi:hypothetical protein
MCPPIAADDDGMAPSPNRRNHYRLLHVQPEAPLEVIKSSYRTLMMRMKLHPDLGGDHEMAAALNEAYAVLSDPQRRAEYDRQLRLRSRPELMRQEIPSKPSARAAPSAAASYASSTDAYLYARAGAQGHLSTAKPVTCAFCGLPNALARVAPALCQRCGAPLTPVRHAPLPRFGEAGHNRRQSVRRPRQSEAVAYWGMPPQRHRVLWRDLSAGGLSVWTAQAVPVGQRLQLMDPEIHTVAEVVACDAGPRESWLIRARLLTLRPIRRSGLFCSTEA